MILIISPAKKMRRDLDFLEPRGLPVFLEKTEQLLAMEGPAICEVFVTLDQNFEPKSASKRLPDGTMVSPPLEDLAPFLPDEEMDRIMLIPRIRE